MKTLKLSIKLLLVIVLLLSSCTWLELITKRINWRDQIKPNLDSLCNWVTYYGPYYNKQIINDLNDYDMVVVGWMDKAQRTPRKPIVFQYLAVVEAGLTHRQHYDWLKDIDESYRLFDNPDYPGAWIIDIRKQEWQDLIIAKAIPWTMDHGGQGLMLDTFGNISLYLGNASEYREAAIKLIKRIHDTYPNLPILVNEPGDLINDIYPYIDGMIFEQYMSDIRTGELFSQPRSTWGNAEVDSTIQLRNSLLPAKNLLLLTCDMVKNNDSTKSAICLSKSLTDGLLPSLTPYSSFASRYHKLSFQYWEIIIDH